MALCLVAFAVGLIFTAWAIGSPLHDDYRDFDISNRTLNVISEGTRSGYIEELRDSSNSNSSDSSDSSGDSSSSSSDGSSSSASSSQTDEDKDVSVTELVRILSALQTTNIKANYQATSSSFETTTATVTKVVTSGEVQWDTSNRTVYSSTKYYSSGSTAYNGTFDSKPLREFVHEIDNRLRYLSESSKYVELTGKSLAGCKDEFIKIPAFGDASEPEVLLLAQVLGIVTSSYGSFTLKPAEANFQKVGKNTFKLDVSWTSWLRYKYEFEVKNDTLSKVTISTDSDYAAETLILDNIKIGANVAPKAASSNRPSTTKEPYMCK